MRSSNADDHERRTQKSNPRKRPAERMDQPVYGNFQRYYHIRNPASSAPEDEPPSSSVHPALAIDSRVSAILRYLRKSYTHHKPTAGNGGRRPHHVNVLDLGCNSGKVTIELAQTLPKLLRECGQPLLTAKEYSRDTTGYGPIQLNILGVDIDPSLVKQARVAAAVARSRYRPERLHDANEQSKGHGCDSDDSLPSDCAYFPSVFPSLYGCIPSSVDEEVQPRYVKRHIEDTGGDSMITTPKGADQPSQDGSLSLPCLDFVALDWVNPEAEQRTFPTPHSHYLGDRRVLDLNEQGGYHITLALSITKWIHIQQGDLGLILFFARIADTLKQGGLLFLERQEWVSYHSAKNLDPTIKSKTKALKLRPGGDFDWWLETLGLRVEAEIGQGVGFGFSRPLQVFRKESTSQGEAQRAKTLVAKLLADRADNTLRPIPWVARAASSTSCRADQNASTT